MIFTSIAHTLSLSELKIQIFKNLNMIYLCTNIVTDENHIKPHFIYGNWVRSLYNYSVNPSNS